MMNRSNMNPLPPFAQPSAPIEQTQEQPGQLVPHYGPGGSYYHDSNYYQNYQVPPTTKPQYASYASISAAAGIDFECMKSTSLHQGPSGNTAEDVLAAFESAPSTSLMSTTPTTTPLDDAYLSSFSKEEIAEQQRLMQEIEQRKSLVAPKVAADLTVYEQQDRLWNSYHHTKGNSGNSVIPHHLATYSSTMTVYDESQNSGKLIHVPRSNNPSGSDAVHPLRAEMKQARKIKTATAATGGAIVGGVLFGPAWPLGVLVGGAAGAVAGKQISKAGERRAQRNWEKNNYQQYAASESAVVKGSAAFA